jgi:hypothetical protein
MSIPREKGFIAALPAHYRYLKEKINMTPVMVFQLSKNRSLPRVSTI